MAGDGSRSGSGRAPSAGGEAAFRKHLATYLAFALFFFALDVITGLGDWWFFWPVFFWGWAVVFQAVALYGTDAPARVGETIRSMVPGAAPGPRPVPTPPPNAGRQAVSVAPGVTPAEAEARVAQLWRTARRIPTPAARERAFAVCAAADRVAEVMAEDKTDPRTVRWFIDRYLSPTEALIERYARLAQRHLPDAEATLAKVEAHDFPLLERRLDGIYQQLHRGDVIDLAVASEMLELEGFDDRLPSGGRSGLS